MQPPVLSPQEQLRIGSLRAMLPRGIQSLLEIGSRDGRVTQILVEHSEAVTALDLERPRIDHPRVRPVRGNVTALDFPDDTFDCVVCTEVLEHVVLLDQACAELTRVSRKWLLVGVPCEQDLRIRKMTCSKCGGTNAPYGHVNSFSEAGLKARFGEMQPRLVEKLGTVRQATNPVSVWLLDRCRNPWGTYDQEEPCIHCGARLVPPSSRTVAERMASKLAVSLNRAQQHFTSAKPIWIHCLFEKQASDSH